jgi:hypothetical protein
MMAYSDYRQTALFGLHIFKITPKPVAVNDADRVADK